MTLSKGWIIVTKNNVEVDAVPISTDADLAAEKQKLEHYYPFPEYNLGYYSSSRPVTAREISAGWETDGFREHDEAVRRQDT